MTITEEASIMYQTLVEVSITKLLRHTTIIYLLQTLEQLIVVMLQVTVYMASMEHFSI